MTSIHTKPRPELLREVTLHTTDSGRVTLSLFALDGGRDSRLIERVFDTFGHCLSKHQYDGADAVGSRLSFYEQKLTVPSTTH